MERKPKFRKLFSTGQVADLLGVNIKKVVEYIDSGLLKGLHLPGMTERRVPREEVRLFCSRYEHVWALRELDNEEGIAPPPAEGEPPIPPAKTSFKKKKP